MPPPRMISTSWVFPQAPPMWTNIALSSKSAASVSAFFSDIQRHLSFDSVSTSCSVLVGGVAGAGAVAACCAAADDVAVAIKKHSPSSDALMAAFSISGVVGDEGQQFAHRG